MAPERMGPVDGNRAPGRAAWNRITSDPFRFAFYGPFTSWNAKKATHMDERDCRPAP